MANNKYMDLLTNGFKGYYRMSQDEVSLAHKQVLLERAKEDLIGKNNCSKTYGRGMVLLGCLFERIWGLKQND